MFCIQDPSYEDSFFLHESLLKECVGSINGAGAYAYATKDGIIMLLSDETFKTFLSKGKFCLIVGIDEITNAHSINTLIDFKHKYAGNLIVKAYMHNSKGSTFHPKFSWFQYEDGGSLVIGSGNLTQKGLRHNREAYSIIEYDKKGILEVINEWNRWVSHSTPFLFDIEDDLVLVRARQNAIRLRVTATAKLALEKSTDFPEKKELEKLYESQPKNQKYKPPVKHTTKDPSTDGVEPKQNVPVSSIKVKEELADIENTPDVDEDFDVDASYWRISKDCEILIAEIPKSGNRWKQANFDKSTFEDYFGATCGKNGIYRVLLKSISSDGRLGETEIRPSVSVTSKNYRFELNAANGLDYPEDGRRPIAVFAKISCRDFLYELFMPEDKNYDSITAFMIETEKPSAQMRRLRYHAYDVYTKIDNLPLWDRLEKDE